MKKSVWMVVFLFPFLAACEHTVQGFGQDMQHAGQSIQRSAS